MLRFYFLSQIATRVKLIIIPTKADRSIKAKGGSGSLSLLSSHLGLINVDLELATQLGGASFTEMKRRHLKVYSKLLKGIDELDSQKYDFVLFDCPPNFNIVTKNAIVASDSILIPAKP